MIFLLYAFPAAAQITFTDVTAIAGVGEAGMLTDTVVTNFFKNLSFVPLSNPI